MLSRLYRMKLLANEEFGCFSCGTSRGITWFGTTILIDLLYSVLASWLNDLSNPLDAALKFCNPFASVFISVPSLGLRLNKKKLDIIDTDWKNFARILDKFKLPISREATMLQIIPATIPEKQFFLKYSSSRCPR